MVWRARVTPSAVFPSSEDRRARSARASGVRGLSVSSRATREARRFGRFETTLFGYGLSRSAPRRRRSTRPTPALEKGGRRHRPASGLGKKSAAATAPLRTPRPGQEVAGPSAAPAADECTRPDHTPTPTPSDTATCSATIRPGRSSGTSASCSVTLTVTHRLSYRRPYSTRRPQGPGSR